MLWLLWLPCRSPITSLCFLCPNLLHGVQRRTSSVIDVLIFNIHDGAQNVKQICREDFRNSVIIYKDAYAFHTIQDNLSNLHTYTIQFPPAPLISADVSISAQAAYLCGRFNLHPDRFSPQTLQSPSAPLSSAGTPGSRRVSRMPPDPDMPHPEAASPPPGS